MNELALGPVLVLAMIAISLLMGLALLVAHRKTRAVGVVLLLLLVVPAVLVFGMLIAWRAASHQSAMQADAEFGEFSPVDQPFGRIEVSPPQPPKPIQSQRVVATPPRAVAKAAAPTAPVPASPAPANGQAGSRSTFRALASAITETLRRELQAREEAIRSQAEQALAKDRAEAAKREALAKMEAAKTLPAGKTETPKVAMVALARDARSTSIPVESTEAAKSAAVPASPRPAWVDRPEGVIDGDYQMVVMAGPYENRQKCDEEMRTLLPQAVRKFAARQLGIGEAEAAQIDLPLDFIRGQVVKDQYVETRNTELGPWIQVNALLQFDHNVKARIDQQWNQVRVNRRLWATGGGLIGMLWLLSVAYGYLKIDLATKGNYRGRLRLGAVALVAATAVVGLRLLA